MLKKHDQENIEKAWSNVPKRLPRTRWWESTTILQHIAKNACGFCPDDANWGKAKLLELNRTFQKAISVGGGSGTKEMSLIESNIVQHFDIYELSRERILNGQKIAQEKGLEDKITFHYGDFFASPHNMSNHYDLVFWSGSLHHMLDTKFAILSSYDILKNDGYFYCDEYVGKNRFQFSNIEVTLATGVRSVLPKAVFNVPNSDPAANWPTMCGKPSIEAMIKSDISEAADSENIIPSIEKIFPHASIIHLGGLVFHFALSDILTNIPEDCGLLQDLLRIDDQTILHNFHHYAFSLAPKRKP